MQTICLAHSYVVYTNLLLLVAAMALVLAGSRVAYPLLNSVNAWGVFLVVSAVNVGVFTRMCSKAKIA